MLQQRAVKRRHLSVFRSQEARGHLLRELLMPAVGAISRFVYVEALLHAARCSSAIVGTEPLRATLWHSTTILAWERHGALVQRTRVLCQADRVRALL